MKQYSFTVTITAGTPVQVSSTKDKVGAIEFHARSAFDSKTGKGNRGNVYHGRNDTHPISGNVSSTNGREITPGSSHVLGFGKGSVFLSSFFVDGDNSGDLVDITVTSVP